MNDTLRGTFAGIKQTGNWLCEIDVHRLNRDISGKLQYRFNYYEEPSVGGANNYCTHTVFASMTPRLR